MNDALYENLMKLPKSNIIALMWAALDEMQAYNGRTRTFCIVEAAGGEVVEGEDGRTKYRLPSVAKMKENTNSMGL